MTLPDTPRPAPPAAPVPEPVSKVSDRYKQRAITARVLVYVVVAHLLALYLYLMFAVVGKR